MDRRYKYLKIKLSKILTLTTYQFFIDNLEEEENISDVINLIISAGMSSIFNCITEMVSEHEEISMKVKEFIDNLKNHIASLEPITRIEKI